jgi:hypothetical protein
MIKGIRIIFLAVSLKKFLVALKSEAEIAYLFFALAKRVF